MSFFIRDNTNLPTCAIDRVDTAQNGSRPRITEDYVFLGAIMVNDTSEMAVDRDLTAIDELGQQQVFACMEYDHHGNISVQK